jgi:hypothetical protein
LSAIFGWQNTKGDDSSSEGVTYLDNTYMTNNENVLNPPISILIWGEPKQKKSDSSPYPKQNKENGSPNKLYFSLYGSLS